MTLLVWTWRKRLCHTSYPRWLDSNPAAEGSGAIFWHGSGGVKTALKSIRAYGWEGKDLATAYQEAYPSFPNQDRPCGKYSFRSQQSQLIIWGSYADFPFKRHNLGKESESSNTTGCWESLQDTLKQQSVVKASVTKVPETYVYWIKSQASE